MNNQVSGGEGLPELLPCPFCGNEQPHVQSDLDNSVSMVVCGHCGSSSDWNDSPEDSVTAWNTCHSAKAAEGELPQPVGLIWPGEGFTQTQNALNAWKAHMYDTGAEPLFSADQLHSYAASRVAQAGQHAARIVGVEAGTSCNRFQLLDSTNITDAMVESYCDAVEQFLACLTPKDWEIESFDPKASVRKVARIGLQAAMVAARAGAD